MSNLAEIVELGKEIGLEGEELKEFIIRKDQEERDERAKLREQRSLEIEAEKVKQEVELRRLQLEAQKTLSGSTVSENICKPAFPKLPVFNEQQDSIDAYLLRFERLATSAKWSKDLWAISLASLLQGKALETYQHLSPEEAKDYDEVKSALLRCFQCTPEGYRNRFRSCKMLKNETASQFGNRLKNFFTQWTKLAGCRETYEDVVDLMLVEQFTSACDKGLVLFIREHDVTTFGQVIKLADIYMDAHGGQSKEKSCEPKRSQGKDVSIKPELETKEVQKKPGSRECYVCGRANHTARDCYQRFGARKKDKKLDSEKAAVATNCRLIVSDGKVEGKDVKVLRDQGCTTVIVRRSLVPKSKFTGREVELTMANGMNFKYPEVEISVQTPYYSGITLAACIDNPVYDLIVGQIDGVRSVGEGSEVSAAVTRQRSKQARDEPNVKLKVTDVKSIVCTKDIKQKQEEDTTLNNIRKYIAMCRVFKKSARESHCYVKKKGILYRRVELDGCHSDQLVVPRELRVGVMKLAHSAVMGGHLGRKKTLARIQNKFVWPGISSDVSRFCRSCDQCQRTVDRGRVPRAKLGRMPIIEEPFRRVAVDLVGPLEPRASDGSRYILTVVDYATRYPEAVALKSCDTVSVAEALLAVFSRVGIPREILSDKGSQFTSEMMREFHRLLSVKSLTTTPYHAMCNGLVERFNGVLKKMLKRMCTEQPKEWPRFLNPLLFAYREVPQSSTTFAPFELIYGHTVRGPLSLLREVWEDEGEENEGEGSSKTVYEYLINLRERLQDTCKLAHEELGKAGEKYQQYYDKRAKDRELAEGQRVLVLLPTSSNKLLMQWKGPFEVVRKVNRWNFVVNVNGVERKYHINMLKQYFTMEDQSNGIVDGGLSCAVVAVEEESSDEACIPVIPSYRKKEARSDVKINSNLSLRQKRDIDGLTKRYDGVFSDVPGQTDVLQHNIKLKDFKPVKSKPYPIPFALQSDIEEEIKHMLSLGVIEHSESPYATPLLVVKKKDQSNRVCLDFRKINSLTTFDAEPMPDQVEIMSKLAHCKYFSKIDLAKGYWQIPLDECSRQVTAFQTSQGLFQFRVMPFGLVNASATFNRLMRILFGDMSNVATFVDDILIHTNDWDSHVKALGRVLERLESAGLTARPTKCELGQYTVEYLGHMIGSGETKPVFDKVLAISNMKTPKTKKEVRSFLGMTGYYRQYIPNYSTLAYHLTELTKKSLPNNVVWEYKHQEAFDLLKKILCESPVLKLVDLEGEFTLQTDASKVGLGAVLLQNSGERWPIAYASRKLKKAELNYSVIELECLAVVWGINKFFRYLYGRHFSLEIDHKPLLHLQTACNLNGRLMRWCMFLQQFSFTIVNIKGSDNVGADCLSRLPC